MQVVLNFLVQWDKIEPYSRVEKLYVNATFSSFSCEF